jgi:hypothetical protein
MELLGNFRNFDFSKGRIALLFIMPGVWNVYLLEQVDPAQGWPRAILGEGKCRFTRASPTFTFYSNDIKVEIKRTGLVRQILFEQNGFKMLRDLQDREDLLFSLHVFAGKTVTIDRWGLVWS